MSWRNRLRITLLSGDWVRPSIAQMVWSIFTNTRILALGGATECSIWSILHEVEPEDLNCEKIPYGKAMSGQWVAVCNSELEMLPTYAVGEIIIGGCGVAAGYLSDKQLTTEKFCSLPNGDRIYHTGDFGRLLPNGEIEFLGRRDQQVKVAGNRIELPDIEHQMIRIDGVDQACAVVHKQGDEVRLAVFYAGSRTAQEVRAALSEYVAKSMMPTICHQLDRLPLATTGKVDRNLLARLAEDGPKNAEAIPVDGESVNGKLLGVISEFTGGRSVSDDDDLTELGLNSVSVIRILNAIEREFSVRPSIGEFYAKPTLAQLASAIEELVADRRSPGLGFADGQDTNATSIWKEAIQEPDRQPISRLRPTEGIRVLPMQTPVLDADITTRRSYREFIESPVPVDRFSFMLSCLRQVNRDSEPAFYYPSAGATYAVDVFVAVKLGRVEGVSAGLYYYDPTSHDLLPSTEHVSIHENVNLGSVNRGLARSAAFCVLLVTDPWRTVSKYGKAAERLAYLNSGYMGQLLSESARSVGLGLCAVDGIEFGRIAELLPQGEQYTLLHALYGGVPTAVGSICDQRFEREKRTL